MTPLSVDRINEIAGTYWDAVVVGAGPAGGLAAYELARRNRRTLLVEKARFPRRKVCGCCLNARALSALATAGLGRLAEEQGGVPLREFRVGAGGRQAVVSLPGGLALSRERFDAALAEEATRAGAVFLPETVARLGRFNGHTRAVGLRRGDTAVDVEAKVVLAADGLGGRLLRDTDFEARPSGDSRLGAGSVTDEFDPGSYLPGVVYMACGGQGYVGLVRIEDGRLNVAAAFDVDFLKASGSMGHAAAEILRAAGFPPVPRIENLPWRGTPALTRGANRVGAPGVFVLGDAAGYVEPFTGEGMAWALTSAVAVAALADRGIDTHDPALEMQWARLYGRLVRRRQWVCRLLAAGLRRPRLVRAAVHAVGALPAIARPFVRHVNLPLNEKGLA